MTWRAIQVYTGQELRFVAHLLRDGLEGYTPSYQASVRWSDRTKTVPRALFPGYVFALFGPRERSTLVRVPQLVRILDIELAAVEMERIKTLELTPTVEPAAFGELIGQEVIFGPNHPLCGTHGRAIAAGKGYAVRVEVEILGRAVKVTCDGFDLLPDPGYASQRGAAGNQFVPGPAGQSRLPAPRQVQGL